LASVGVSTDDDIELQKPKALKKANPKKSIEGVASSNESVFASMNSADLKSALMQAIDEEDYETASKIRDELTKRKEL
jgi:protein-arginine kinase activator protein McsA